MVRTKININVKLTRAECYGEKEEKRNYSYKRKYREQLEETLQANPQHSELDIHEINCSTPFF